MEKSAAEEKAAETVDMAISIFEQVCKLGVKLLECEVNVSGVTIHIRW